MVGYENNLIMSLTTKLGPIALVLHLSISRRQNSIMVWSFRDCSRMPHLRSIICSRIVDTVTITVTAPGLNIKISKFGGLFSS